MRRFAWLCVGAGLLLAGVTLPIVADRVLTPYWPGLLIGAGVSAFGVLLLAIRRPEGG